MKTIKFSHDYEKRPENVDDTVLLEVFVTDDLSERFKQYDTLIKGKNPFFKESYYQLPEGKKIVLLLKSAWEGTQGEYVSQVWTTIRIWTKEKEEYYRNIRGSEVKIEVLND